jgi:predicted nucleotide-binding protein/predicted ester cyclase
MNRVQMVAILALVAIMATVGILGAGAPVRAQEATPAAECIETTPEENKALVEAYFAETYNAGNAEAAARFFNDDFVRSNPARPQVNEPGTADDVQRVAENLADFPDIQITIEEILAEGDRVAALMTWSGTHSDVIDQWNAPATGNPTSFAFMAMYRVECGLLAEQWVVLDYFSMVRELGIVTDEELATIGNAAQGTPPAAATAPETPEPAPTAAAQTRPERPRVFIGSSVEGLAVAEAIEFDLQFFADVTLWDQGVFHLSQGTLAALQQAAANSDFAILVLTADDVTTRRGQTYLTARDNVIFELGFFMGHLGPERTFIVYSRDNSPTLPSDLAGITVATFAERADGNMDAAVGPASIQIRDAMRAVMANEGDG